MGKQFSANKPEGIETLAGIDLVMADEGHDPYRLEAFSYYGLFKPVMVLDGDIWKDPEPTLKTCLRLAMMYNDMNYEYSSKDVNLPPDQMARNIRVRDAYTPLLQELVGRQWVLDPEAMELPPGVGGNIYRVPDGRVIVTLTSDGRSMFDEGHFAHDLPVVVRFEDMDKVRRATVRSVDYPEADTAGMKLEGDALTITVPRHRTASMVILD